MRTGAISANSGSRQSNFERLLFALTLGATLLVTKPCLAEGVPVSEATSGQQRTADRKLAEGKKLLKAGKAEQALAAFEAAHEVVADPEASLLIARAQLSAGELLKAHAAFSAAVREAEAAIGHDGKYRETLRAARAELKDLEGVLAHVTIQLRHAPEGTNVTIDGAPLGNRKLGEPILVAPGPISIVAQTSDGRETSRQLTLSAGQDAKVDLVFVRDDSAQDAPAPADEATDAPATAEEPKPAGNGKRTAAFIAGGVGVAGLVTFGVLGAMSNSKFNGLEEACPNARCAANQQNNIDKGKLYQTLANVGLAVGVVGLGAATALFVWGGSGSSDKPTNTARLELQVGPRFVGLRGRFE